MRTEHRVVRPFASRTALALRGAFLMITFLAFTGEASAQPHYSDRLFLSSIGSLGNASNGLNLSPLEPAVADLNGDGLDDVIMHLGGSLILPHDPTPIKILLNDGAGSFIDGTNIVISGPIPVAFWIREFVIKDLNGDGQLDIFMGGTGLEVEDDPRDWPGEQNLLLLSGSDGRLHDVTATNLPNILDFTHPASAADIDGDGDIDFWVNNLSFFAPSYLMVNDGSGKFTIVADVGIVGISEIVGLNGLLPKELATSALGFWSQFVDADNDGDQDLWLGLVPNFNNSGEDRMVLLLNDGTGAFTLADPQGLPVPLFGGTGLTQESTTHDINNDGLQDLVFTQGDSSLSSGKFQFLINNGDGTFRDETDLRLSSLPDTGNAPSNQDFYLRDIDGDGDIDFLSYFNFTTPDFYENDGSGVFTRLPTDFVNVDPPLDFQFIPVDADGDGGVDFIDGGGKVNDAGEVELFLIKALGDGNEGRLTNISTRGLVQTGDNVQIAGLIIGGADPKTVLIRARGPALADFGVAGVLANPLLQLFDVNGTVIANNDDWETTTALCQNSGLSCGGAAEITATELEPCRPVPLPGQPPMPTGCSLEAAILVTLPPGNQVSGVPVNADSQADGETGVGLVEVFEVGTASTSKLTNISTRGVVGAGDDVMIGGLIIGGSIPKTVLIRARGPALADFGVAGVLANPFLQLFDVNGTVIANNDDWETTTPLCQGSGLNCGGAAEITATELEPCRPVPLPGQPPIPTGCNEESAILITLPPGNYTAIVSGVTGGTGVGLVEVFEVNGAP